ncbi:MULTISPECIES: GGDEF domain-containing protein [Halomonadaceae]|jgi:diguanylate cyclase (GGDEF)-like protein|uniref:GGDEF domain-containing protein n=1 Tax=Halomonadaceae TaxID=28256 RepID=UPI0020C5BFBC|nr:MULTISPECIES: sensor domain-containing diguanylate cyclase [Halomonas]MDI4637532.1 sensor domain-containing diguanylate cyclase [Halomonas sp. BMC7]
MAFDDTSLDDTSLNDTGHDLDRLKAMTESLPGIVFQFYRSHHGKVCFPYLAGDSDIFGDTAQRAHMSEDAKHAFDHVHPDDFPRLMVAVERSAKSLTPLATQFRHCEPGGEEYWIAVRAKPERLSAGTLWNGLMVNITEQIEYQAHLRELSDTDDLTGLPNRRKLMCHLGREISLSNRHGTPLSLMIIDIDHFKRVNDTWGHLQGDKVLRRLAGLCQGLLREEDCLARLGGEEFAVLLPLTPLSHCQDLAERLRREIAHHDFGLPNASITISTGIAEHRIGELRDQLLERADQRLYAAKRRGRNLVIGA